MLLSVPSDIHDLALASGFTLTACPRHLACSICDQPILRDAPCYSFIHDGVAQDNWCPSCVETKLPSMLASGKALR